MELCPESDVFSSSWLRPRAAAASTPFLVLVPGREGEEDEEEVDSDLGAALA